MQLRVTAALPIPAALADTAVGDIHGLPFLAGLTLASVWLVRDRSRLGNKGVEGVARSSPERVS